MTNQMNSIELMALVARVFQPRAADSALGIMVDLPDAKVGDDADWQARRAIAADWVALLADQRQRVGYCTHLLLYPNVHTNNGDLPERCWVHPGGPLPQCAEDLDLRQSLAMTDVLAAHPMLMALTKFSSTAPLKVAAKRMAIRAATMPGFTASMLPALRLDYGEVNRRVDILKGLMDEAEGADLWFRHPEGEDRLHLDLRFRSAHASGGLLPHPGTAGNLPSGEAYIVPYEGEAEPSRSEGVLPVQFGDEVVRYRIAGNKAMEVLSQGAESRREAALLLREPAYGNLAELGLGVLAAFGVKPIGVVLLDEKLGLHIAFGRSEHFGGQVGPDAFSTPEAVVHIDRVYVPETQPLVIAAQVDFRMADGRILPVIRDGLFCELF